MQLYNIANKKTILASSLLCLKAKIKISKLNFEVEFIVFRHSLFYSMPFLIGKGTYINFFLFSVANPRDRLKINIKKKREKIKLFSTKISPHSS